MSLKEDIQTQTIVKEEIDEIQLNIGSEVDSKPDLSELNSTSKTANYKLWIYVVSYVSWLFKSLWAEKKEEHQTIIDDNVTQNDRWLANLLKDFQYGDPLIFDDNGKPSYAVIDEAKQIIKYVSIRSANGFFKALVAGDDGSENPIVLTNDEINAATSYLNEYILGKNGVIESKSADLAKIYYTIYYDATRELTAIKEDTELAINLYLKGLNFKGEFIQPTLEDNIQTVDRVSYFEATNIEMKKASGTYEGVGVIYNPESGYIKIDPSFPLSTTLTYQPIQ